MKYRINEIFHSLQGEGMNAGRAAVFVRFSGCNLRCPFCDTDFKAFKEMSASEIVTAIYDEVGDNPLPSLCVLTGGEPTLQVDNSLIDALHDTGMEVSMETNGTHPVNALDLDFVTVSPKTPYVDVDGSGIVVDECSEVKVIMTKKISVEAIRAFEAIKAEAYYIQPCDTGFIRDNAEIMQRCVEFIKYHPNWRLSLQQQKILKVR